jgi:mono/diheme cytochrome c family protein
MKRVLKWTGIVLGSLIGLLLIALLIGFLRGSTMLTRQYDELAEGDTDLASGDAQHGQVLAMAYSCTRCHGADLGGADFINEQPLGSIPAPNLTSGEGGAAATFSDADFERAIRHGIAPDDTGLAIMPSSIFHSLADSEVADLIAYVRGVEPIDQTLPGKQIGPMIPVLLGLGIFPANELFTAAGIDQAAPHLEEPPTEMMELGAYRAVLCTQCHRADFSGGPLEFQPGVLPPNLTPHETGLAGWSEADFITAMRTGLTPDGEQLDPVEMPWPGISQFSDAELHALWEFLQSQPAVPQGE